MIKVTINPAQKRSLMQKIRNLIGQQAPDLVVGFLADATYPDGTQVAAVAAYNEYGTKNTPPRPFMQATVKFKRKKWMTFLASKMKKGRLDGDTKVKVMKQMGVLIKSDLQGSIRSLKFAPLKPSTIKAKGFNKTLIDTATMIRSIDWEIRDNKK